MLAFLFRGLTGVDLLLRVSTSNLKTRALTCKKPTYKTYRSLDESVIRVGLWLRGGKEALEKDGESSDR